MRKIVVMLFAAALSLAPAQAAFAEPPGDGCPKGHQLWDVNAEPYQADNRTDAEGNDDGLVCAWAMGNQTFIDGSGQERQIYRFADNDLPASG